MTENDKKRDREINSSPEEQRAFSKSKRIIRSPTQILYTDNSDTNNIETDTMDGIREPKGMIKEMMQGIKRNSTENRELREEMRMREEQWKKERIVLTDRITVLEEKIELQKRKNAGTK